MPLEIAIYDYCRGCRRKSETLVVQSREGGFVTRDCTSCGESNSVRLVQLPVLICGGCSGELEPTKNRRGNYAYDCRVCAVSTELARIVPFWDEVFSYSGYGIETDEVLGA